MSTRAEKMLGITRSSYHKKRMRRKVKTDSSKMTKTRKSTPSPTRVKTVRRLPVKSKPPKEAEASTRKLTKVVDSKVSDSKVADPKVIEVKFKGTVLLPYLQTTPMFGKEYEALELIGVGAWGFVFKTLDKRTKQFVAAKVQPEAEGDMLHNDKITMVALRNSPYVPLILNYFKNEILFDGKTPITTVNILVMELLEGYETLNTYAQGKCLMQPGKLAAKMFRCLNSVHAENVVHADVSTENFMVKGPDIKLVDFGSAHFEPKTKRPEGAEGTHEFTSARVDKAHFASFADDAEAAAFVYWRLQRCNEPLPWYEIENDAQRAKSKSEKSLESLGASREVLFIVRYVRSLKAGQLPDYSKICAMLDKDGVKLPDRTLEKLSVEQKYRLSPKLDPDLNKLPFLTAEDVVKLEAQNIATSTALFSQFNFVWDGGVDTLSQKTLALTVQFGVARMVANLVKFGLDHARAGKFAAFCVPARVFS